MNSTSKFIAILVAVLALASIVLSATLKQADDKICSLSKWKMFKEKFSRSYDEKSGEDKSRAAIFCENLQRILAHNANPNATYTLGLNQFSDRTAEERARMLLGGLNSTEESLYSIRSLMKMEDLSSNDMLRVASKLQDEPPTEVDWSQDPRRVSPARAQGDCGSCWAFATVAMLEGQEKPENGSLVRLSEQNLVDCDIQNSGCNGGLIYPALEEIKRYGGVMERIDYPYVSGQTKRRGTCKMDPKVAYKSTTNLGETRLIKQGDEELLKVVVAAYGPVAVGIYAKQDFFDYKGGVYYNENCWGLPNHAITIVGYGKDNRTGLDYWKIKNSWSERWGESGFGYMVRNKRNNCHIASLAYVSWPKE